MGRRARPSHCGRAHRDIWADFDRDTLVVYQAYDDRIADVVLAAGTFVAPFRFTRMAWIEPSILWRMARSLWGTRCDGWDDR